MVRSVGKTKEHDRGDRVSARKAGKPRAVRCTAGKDGMDTEESIRLVVKHTGRSTELAYYAGSRKVALEVLESHRTVIKEGVIPDGRVVEYYREGAIKRVFQYRNEKPQGKAITYYPTGELWEEQHFEAGKLEGRWVMYRKDGTFWSDSFYLHGKLHGLYKSYQENGQMETSAHYEKGKLQGVYEYNDRFGCLREKGTFRNGQKDGIYTTYHESGEIASMDVYENGIILHSRTFTELENHLIGELPEATENVLKDL